MIRSRFILFLLVLLAAVPANAAPERIRVALNWYANAEYAGLLLARDNGWYRAAGLDVEFVFEAKDMLNRIQSHQYDIGILPTHRVIEANTQGLSLRAFANHYQIDPHVLLADANGPIVTLNDLRGRKLGVASEHEKRIYRALLDHHGVERSAAQFVKISAKDDEQVYQALNRGEIDVFFGWEFSSALLFSLKRRALRHFPVYRHGFYLLGPVFFGEAKTVKKKAAALARFIQVSRLGWMEALMDCESVADRAVRRWYPKKRLKQQDLTMIRRQQKLILTLSRRFLFEGIDEHGYGRMTMYGWERTLHLAQKLEILPTEAPVDPAGYVDFEVLKRVDAARSKR